MYTLLELESKTFGELKKIGYELNVLPGRDRRYRQSWIDALVNVNPPLLQLLEDSPAALVGKPFPVFQSIDSILDAEVDPVEEPIVHAPESEKSSGVEVDRVQIPLMEAAETSPGVEVEQVRIPLMEAAEISPGVEVEQVQIPLMEAAEISPGVEVEQVQIPLMEAAETSPGVELDPVQHPIIEMVETFPAAEVEQAQEAIAQAAKNLPGSRLKTSTAHQLLKLFKSSAHIIEDFPGVKTEVTVSESAIAPAVKTSFDAESDRNPILTGIHLSDNFLARYSSPHPEYVFASEADGQMSLLDFEVVTESEPPDPDDFETLDAFREAISRWDWEHPSSFDHCSDLPNSVYSEPNSVPCEPNSMPCEPNSMPCEPNSVPCEPNSMPCEPLEVSLDSFCLWAHCSAYWYEPVEVLELSKVMGLSPINKNSSTSDFFIPTFDRWGDPNKSDEPPDTGIFARLPKPKPSTFPPQASLSQPQAASWTQVGHKLDTSWTQVTPKLFHRVAAGSSPQPARSPPGGDAMF
jgi:hypothetical protein